MTDRGKVVKGLECCASISAGIKTCGYIPTQNDCPYSYLIEEDWNGCDSHVECTNALAADALKLLKEQEQQIERLEHDLAVTQNNLNYYVNGND